MLILLGFLSLSVIGSAKPQQTFEEKNYLIEMTQEKSELTSENNSSSTEENRKEEQNLLGKKEKKLMKIRRQMESLGKNHFGIKL